MTVEERLLQVETGLKQANDKIAEHEATLTKLGTTLPAPGATSAIAKPVKKEVPKLSGTEFTVSFKPQTGVDSAGKAIYANAAVTKTGKLKVPSLRFGANTYTEAEALEKDGAGKYVNNDLLVHLMRDTFYKGKSAFVEEVF